jgi:hypothetical protein
VITRSLSDAMNGLGCAPNNNLLGDRSENEACCLAEPGKPCAVEDDAELV